MTTKSPQGTKSESETKNPPIKVWGNLVITPKGNEKIAFTKKVDPPNKSEQQNFTNYPSLLKDQGPVRKPNKITSSAWGNLDLKSNSYSNTPEVKQNTLDNKNKTHDFKGKQNKNQKYYPKNQNTDKMYIAGRKNAQRLEGNFNIDSTSKSENKTIDQVYAATKKHENEKRNERKIEEKNNMKENVEGNISQQKCDKSTAEERPLVINKEIPVELINVDIIPDTSSEEIKQIEEINKVAEIIQTAEIKEAPKKNWEITKLPNLYISLFPTQNYSYAPYVCYVPVFPVQ